MSPAAQRLATSKLGIRIGTDKALKAAYTPSPMRKSSTRATPTPTRTKDLIGVSVRSTPKSSRMSTTPKIDHSESLTDDLLNLPSSSSKRSKASDFM